MTQLTFPTREALRRLPFTPADAVVVAGTLALIVGVAYLGSTALVPFAPPDVLPEPIHLDIVHLPYYLARSTLRMFIALFFSLLFTFTYGYVAAHSPRAERVLVPLLDVLQSVPVLGFLSVTILFFIALFPGSLLGLEAASIFAIFTSQVWNMTFTFYQSLRTIPREQREMAKLFRFSRWQYFTKVEVPNSMIGLVWNTMMSFGGGWFFVAASEAISVLNREYTLPGIGAYVTEAINQESFTALFAALVAMAVMIVLVDQLVWRPLIAWSQKFRNEQTEASQTPTSWVLDIWRAARLPTLLSALLRPAGEAVNRFLNRALGSPFKPADDEAAPTSRLLDVIYNTVLIVIVVAVIVVLATFIVRGVGLAEVGTTFVLGLITLARVVVLTALSTAIYVPLGVAIGFNPKLARIIQPFAQFMSSFPANFLFPFVTLALIATGISLDIGAILLMSLGAQWYVLFNVIAGAQSIPSDLREMAANMGLRGWHLWKRLILPGIFSAWVTGGITASGGAWNASIVAEIVSWGDTTLVATGLGAYITAATDSGDWPRIALGVGMMALFVVALNRLVWRRLYALTERRFAL